MRRRNFAAFLGVALACPFSARAQQPERVRHIGVFLNLSSDDPEAAARIGAFRQGLQQLGWTEGGNLRIETRWGAGDADRYRRDAAELLALAPEVIFASGAPVVAALQQATPTLPIVFVNVVDPIGGGFVDSLARPGRNTTGVMLFDFGMSGKWLEVLKEIAPDVTRAAVIRDLSMASGSGQLGALQALAPLFNIELTAIDIRDAGQIEHALAAFARGSHDGLIVTASTLAAVHRDVIINLAARHRIPAVYPLRYSVTRGGLISYGPDSIDPCRRAATYVDRILKGEKPADLPVQAPTKYELVINLNTAKTLGLTVPQSLLARADEVIE